jgi:hypothetical protein
MNYLSAESSPIVDDKSGSDDVRASVDGSGHERHLQQRGQLVQIGGRRARMNQTTLKNTEMRLNILQLTQLKFNILDGVTFVDTCDFEV